LTYPFLPSLATSRSIVVLVFLVVLGFPVFLVVLVFLF